MANIKPVLFKLEDLKGDLVKGYYYTEQLIKAPDPNFKTDFFEVEKILSEKTIHKKKYVLVKYLYYPSKFNMWIPYENINFGET